MTQVDGCNPLKSDASINGIVSFGKLQKVSLYFSLQSKNQKRGKRIIASFYTATATIQQLQQLQMPKHKFQMACLSV